MGIRLPKNLDVKKLKQNIWKTVEPQIENVEKKVELTAVVSHLNSLERRAQADIHSSFICLLHLANEKSKCFLVTSRSEPFSGRRGRRRGRGQERDNEQQLLIHMMIN